MCDFLRNRDPRHPTVGMKLEEVGFPQHGAADSGDALHDFLGLSQGIEKPV